MTSLRQKTVLPLRGTSDAMWFTLVARQCGLPTAVKGRVVGFVHSMRPNI